MVAVLPASTFVKSCVGGVAQVAGVGGVESSFLTQSVACVTSQSHPDYPALLVLIEYLCALEVGPVAMVQCRLVYLLVPQGPMWRQIRGMGLAYHYRSPPPLPPSLPPHSSSSSFPPPPSFPCSMSCLPETGRLTLRLFKSAQLLQAHSVAQAIIVSHTPFLPACHAPCHTPSSPFLAGWLCQRRHGLHS